MCRKLLNPFLLSILLILNGTAAFAQAQITSVKQVTEMTNAEAAKGLPVKIEATVTYIRPSEKNMFVSEDGYGLYMRYGKDMGLVPGDRLQIVGKTGPSFRPVVLPTEIRFLAHGALPTPIPARYEDLITAKLDSRYIRISGHLLAAAYDDALPLHGLRFTIKVPLGVAEGVIANPGNLRPEQLLDADVELSAVAAGSFDSKMQMGGVWLDVYSSDQVVLQHQPGAEPWSVPAIPMEKVIAAYRYSNESQRVHIAGTLTYFEPGTLAVVEQGGNAMVVETRSTLPLHAGAGVEATGFPEVEADIVRLTSGELRALPQTAPVTPQPIQWEDASAGTYAYNLVSMEGKVVSLVHDSRVDLFVIRSNGHLFSATLRHTSADAPAGEQSSTIAEGSRVRVTGVCFLDKGDHWRDRLWFDIRMRSAADIAVIEKASWWTVKRLAYLTMVLSAVILVAVLWVLLLDRRVRKQSAVLARQSQEEAARERSLARQEQQRSRILELISSAEPLTDVLREIRSMVSSRLSGAVCWFELNANVNPVNADQGQEMDRPTGPAMIFQELFSPEGVSLGFLLATPGLNTPVETDIKAALVVGARLAELAIDTRRLYSDLRHRSEHDLLTEIPNRFSMEKQLDQLLLRASRNQDIFGVIYVDLDEFKQVNDRYGHRTGDLYLQEVTRRMKIQLRQQDVLARIGGDEFIALVPILRSRADAEEIMTRLERCFDEEFEIEGYHLRGSASVGLAVFPEDGANKEDLQRSADAAMYAHKQTKREQDKLAQAMHRTAGDSFTF